MVAVVFTSPIEAELLLAGRVDEPGFRPHPLARHDEDEDGDGGPTGEGSLRPSADFDQTVAARDWRRHSYEHAVVVDASAAGSKVIGVAVVAGGPRQRFRGTRTLRISGFKPLQGGTSPSDVSEALPRRHAARWIGIVADRSTRPLPARLGASVVAALSRLDPGFAAAWSSLPQQPLPQVRPAVVSQARLDAVTTALRIFTRRWSAQEPVVDPQIPSQVDRLLTALARTEVEFITDDSAVFPGWSTDGTSSGGWREFVDGGRHLYVKNINFTTQEVVTGADLVYIRMNPPSVVLVQYKMLEELKAANQMIFRPDGRLDAQVAAMLALSGDSVDRSPLECDARLGPDFGFVKFIVPGSRVVPGQLVPGSYMPADVARRMLLAPGTGPKGGKLYSPLESRSLDSETFVKLVRDGWVGSVGKTTDDLMAILDVLDTTSLGAVTVAVEA